MVPFSGISGYAVLGLLEGQNEENRKRDRSVKGRLTRLGWGETWIRESQLKTRKKGVQKIKLFLEKESV
jgi:hypothetical protein